MGSIAASLLTQYVTKPPLVVRMEPFTQIVAIVIGIAALGVAAVGIARSIPLTGVFVLAVSLAVGIRGMARRDVIRKRGYHFTSQV